MNALGAAVLGVAKEYLGPAAQQFLSRELRALDCTADTVTAAHLRPLSERARSAAERIMDADRASELAAALAALGAGAAAAPASPPAGAAHGPAVKEGGAPRLALDAAAKLVSTGKLRQAEEAYRQLAQKHGDAASYRGLAAVQAALEDVPAALLALRDGALSLTKAGDRAGAIVLLAEAVALAPADLAAHRRLAAAQANAGDAVAACAEYERYVDYALAEGDGRRAWLELTYARETLGDLPGLVRIVDRLMPGGSAVLSRIAPAPAARPAALSADVRRIVPAEPPAPQPAAAAEELPRTRPVSAASAMVIAGARTLTSPDPLEDAPVDLAARIGPRGKEAVRAAAQAGWKARPPLELEASLAAVVLDGTPEQIAAAAAMRATILIGARDARATEATHDAVRRLLAQHKLQAASDLLLDLIAAGYTDREAQRLLIEVDCGLGRRDVARDKCRLLGEAYRLDGRSDTADDVERLAAII